MSFLIKLQQNLSLFWQNVFFHIWTLQVTLRIEPSFKKEPLTAEKVKKQQFCSTLVTLCVFKLMFMFVQTLISIKLLQFIFVEFLKFIEVLSKTYNLSTFDYNWEVPVLCETGGLRQSP